MTGDSPAIEYFRVHPRVVSALRKHGKAPPAQIPKAQIERFLQDTATLCEMEKLEGKFNLFEAMGIGAREVRHSRVIAWLLDPAGSHGQGANYLQRFAQLTFSQRESAAAPSSIDWAGFTVKCEDERIDLLLVNERSRLVIAIENKVHSVQGGGQLERYRKTLENRFSGYTRIYVFLTLRGETPEDEAWIPLELGRFAREVITPSPPQSDPASARALLFRHYAEWIRASGHPPADNLFEVMHLAGHELRHSDFLRWLLNPRASHGLADSFLRYFLHLIRSTANLPEDFGEGDWADLEVRREFEHIDLLLMSENQRLAIVVENKVFARERPGQIADYQCTVQRHFEHDRLILVFLDMLGRRSSESTAVNLSYADLLPFFDESLCGNPLSPDGTARCLIDQYRALLTSKLWIWEKTVEHAPPALAALASDVWQKNRSEVAALLTEIDHWQKRLSVWLGAFLLEEAARTFHSNVARTDKKLWHSFVPLEFDEIETLRRAGADPAFDGRLLMYQFFVIPFGDTASVRAPQVSIDVKMVAATPEWEPLKAHLHQRAREVSLFNRARGATPSKFDHLLNHELIRVDEVAQSGPEELKIRLRHRLDRFRATIHQDIVAFFREETAAFRPS